MYGPGGRSRPGPHAWCTSPWTTLDGRWLSRESECIAWSVSSAAPGGTSGRRASGSRMRCSRPVRLRRTTPRRLLAALSTYPRLRHGGWLRKVLLDVASGAFSLLEQGYLIRVERAHDLPRAERQRRAPDRATYRDVLHERFGVVIELDGRMGHEWATERWADMDRDLAAGADGLLTVRLGWRHVFTTPCLTASRVGAVLAARGWQGRPRRCGPSCGLPEQ